MKIELKKIPVFLLLSVIAISAMYPLIFMFLNAFKTNSDYMVNLYGLPKHWTFVNFQTLIASYSIFDSLWHSLFVTGISVVVVVILSALASTAFAKYKFIGSKSFFYMLISFMLVPGPALLIPIYVMFSRLQLVDNFLSGILVYIVINLPFGIYLLTTNFRNIPTELIESAQIDGAGFFRIFSSVVFPMGRAAIVTLATLTFLSVWNELLLSMMLLSADSVKMLTPTVAAIAGHFVTNMPLMMSGLFLSALPTILVYLFLSKYLIKGMMVGSIK